MPITKASLPHRFLQVVNECLDLRLALEEGQVPGTTLWCPQPNTLPPVVAGCQETHRLPSPPSPPLPAPPPPVPAPPPFKTSWPTHRFLQVVYECLDLWLALEEGQPPCTQLLAQRQGGSGAAAPADLGPPVTRGGGDICNAAAAAVAHHK
jgi:hypothetical protein